jgi:hypothetical protein
MNPEQTQTTIRKPGQEYSVDVCAPRALTEQELSTCVEIIKDGKAVAITLAKLQNARMLAIARKDGVIVGVGAIKRDRPDRAANIARISGFDFPKETPELGYVAVARQHRRRRLSHRLVDALVKAVPGALYSTTDDENMMTTLSAAGFVRHGSDWRGNRGELSLWNRS